MNKITGSNYMEKKTIKNEIRDDERAYYGSIGVNFINITLQGPVDGESAFKECEDISITESNFYLRYPCWHDENLNISNSTFFDTSRAPLWYCFNVKINDVNCLGVKALRESTNIVIKDSSFVSEEIGWRCSNISIKRSKIDGVYAFFQSEDMKIDNIEFKGKYSFQYVNNVVITNSKLDTKDAFWHSKNVTVIDSLVKGEYLAWYSENLTLIRCHISGTQPLCYCKNLTLIDCTTEDCDLSFENSDVHGNIKGDIISIKNPISGELTIDNEPLYIKDKFDRSRGRFTLIIKNSK